MTFDRTRQSVRRGSPIAYAVTAILSAASAMPVMAQTSEGLEEVVVTAQRRETSLQTTAIAITAYHRRDTRRRQDLHGRRPRQQRALVLADGPDGARPRTQHPRHHQHATRLTVGRPVGRHVRRRRLHRPHRRLQLRLLRPRAHRSHPRPARRAARQERGRWCAQHHHGGAEVRQLGRGDAVVRQLPRDHGVGSRHRWLE